MFLYNQFNKHINEEGFFLIRFMKKEIVKDWEAWKEIDEEIRKKIRKWEKLQRRRGAKKEPSRGWNRGIKQGKRRRRNPNWGLEKTRTSIRK